ncbi:hypothetical protein C5C28_03035 [Rathayibacter rathayi]|nr:hypothetical protein C5C28_03035 [Rathayibacter rathayi]PPI73900.1 hypothetical protein C5E12_03980 [Rathayibacter rathayi]
MCRTVVRRAHCPRRAPSSGGHRGAGPGDPERQAPLTRHRRGGGIACVGFALLLPAGSGFEADPPEAAHLALLAVDPRAQGAGVGRRLLAAVEERAARVAPTVVLHVLTENASALALYTSVGWRPLGTPVPHPLSGASMLTLVRNLPAARRSRTGPRDTLSR